MQVRPIFWSNRPQSYISRTKDWDSFPNGRSAALPLLAHRCQLDIDLFQRHSPLRLLDPLTKEERQTSNLSATS